MDDMTLEKACEAFLRSHKQPTREAYQYPLRDFVRFVGGGKLLDGVNALHVGEWGAELDRRGYKVATYNKYVKSVRVFYNWLIKMSICTTSPAKVLRLRKQNRLVARDKAMTDDDLEKVLDYVRWRARDYALICFLADTGARAGGASGLKWDDVNLLTREATVTEKGDKTRSVAFGGRCAEALEAWRKKCPKSVWVFSRRSTPIKPSAISQVVMRACAVVGVTVRGAHSLRHRKGYQFADARIAPSVAKTALGHENVLTTLQHYYPDDWERAKASLEQLSLGENKL